MVQDTNLGPEIYLNLHEMTNANTGEKQLRSTKYSDADFATMVSRRLFRTNHATLSKAGCQFRISSTREEFQMNI